MRLFLTVSMVTVLLALLAVPVTAQDKGSGETVVKPDLPLEKPVPETAEDPPDEEEPPEQTPPEQTSLLRH